MVEQEKTVYNTVFCYLSLKNKFLSNILLNYKDKLIMDLVNFSYKRSMRKLYEKNFCILYIC